MYFRLKLHFLDRRKQDNRAYVCQWNGLTITKPIIKSVTAYFVTGGTTRSDRLQLVHSQCAVLVSLQAKSSPVSPFYS